MIDTVSEEFAFTLRCIEYLSLPGFDADLEGSAIVRHARQGYYAFLDYAYAYWARHLENSITFANAENDVQELEESLGLFVDMHWTEPKTRISVPKSTLDCLKALKGLENFQKIALAIYISRKELSTFGKPSSTEQVLVLQQVVENVRTALEEMDSSDLHQFY